MSQLRKAKRVAVLVSVVTLVITLLAPLGVLSTSADTAFDAEVAKLETYITEELEVSNATGSDGLLAELKGKLASDFELQYAENGEFYKKEAIGGAEDDTGVLVPGYDGVIAAVLTLKKGTDARSISVRKTIKAPMETYTWGSVEVYSEGNPHFIVNEVEPNWAKQEAGLEIHGYTGTAEKIIIPADSGIQYFGKSDQIGIFASNSSAAKSTLRCIVVADNIRVNAKLNLFTALEVAVLGGAKSLGFAYFQQCYNLRHVKISDEATEIGEMAFNQTYSLRYFKLPDTLQTIGAAAFRSSSITSFDVPAGVTSIADNAFSRQMASGAYDRLLNTSKFISQSNYDKLTAEARDRVLITMNGPTTVINGANAFWNGAHVDQTGNVDPLPVVVRGASGSTAQAYVTANPYGGKVTFDVHLSLPEIAAYVGGELDGLAISDTTTADAIQAAAEAALGKSGAASDNFTFAWSKPYTVTPGSDSVIITGTLSLTETGKSLTFDFPVYARLDRAPLTKAEFDAGVTAATEFLEAYNADNTTTADVLIADILTELADERFAADYIVDFYMVPAIDGAEDNDGVLVPGHDGYIRAVLLLTGSTYQQEIPVELTVEAKMEMFSWASSSEDEPDSVWDIVNGTLYEYTGSAEKVVIPDGVTTVDALWITKRKYDSNIRCIVVPEGVTTLKYSPDAGGYGGGAFANLFNLEVAVLSDSVVDMGGGSDPVLEGGMGETFKYCRKLRYLRLPEKLEKLPDSAVSNCMSLNQLYLPDNLKVIGQNQFIRTSITNITLPESVETISTAFNYLLTSEVLSGYKPKPNGEWNSEVDPRFRVTNEEYEYIRKYTHDVAKPVTITIRNPEMCYYQKQDANGKLQPPENCFATGGIWSNVIVRAEEDSTTKAHIDSMQYGAKVVFEALAPTISEAAAEGQRRLDTVAVSDVTVQKDIEDAVKGILANSTDIALTWAEPFTLTKATAEADGSVKGVIKLTDGDGCEMLLYLDKSLAYSHADEPADPAESTDPVNPIHPTDSTKPDDSGAPTTPTVPDNGNVDTGVETSIMAALLILIGSSLCAAVALCLKKRHS